MNHGWWTGATLCALIAIPTLLLFGWAERRDRG